MPRPRDAQRQKVYNAELIAFALHDPTPRTRDAWQSFAMFVVASDVAKRHLRRAATPQVYLEFGSKRRRRSMCYSGGRIVLAKQDTGRDWMVLHEISHALIDRVHSGVAAHGREWAACYLDLVYEFMGRTWGDALKARFKAGGVKYKPKRVLSPERLAQLREQGKTLAFLAGRRADPA